jgi:hypothetical protein
MWFRSLFNALQPLSSRKQRQRKPRPLPVSPLRLDCLEDRALPSFLPAVPYAVDSNPTQVATGDFNGDGRLDVVTAHLEAGRVDVLLGNGDGTLGVARTFAAGGSPLRVAAGDFNSDGKLDLLDLLPEDNSTANISILLGNGDGTLGTAQTYAVGSGPVVAVADFNGDGKLDTANYSADGVSVFLGNGDGPFGSAQMHQIDFGSQSALVGDFNADGNLDLATASSYCVDYDCGGSVSVLLGNGDGTFTTQNYVLDPMQPYSMATADLNGDGKPDLITANFYNNVGVLLGNGDGTFGAASIFDTGSNPLSVAVGDFNADGKVDVITANLDSHDVSVLLGRGDGTLGPALNFGISPSPGSVIVGDLNGDGKLDAVAADIVVGELGVLLNDAGWPDSNAPAISISEVTVTEGNAGTTTAVFTVSLSAPSSLGIAVSYVTSDGGATAGSDYLAGSGRLTFAPGETSKTVTILVTGDRVGEENEFFLVNLHSPANATIADGQGQGTIMDDEPRINVIDVTKIEGNSGTTQVNFTVSLSAAYDAPVTVHFATANGTATAGNDYQASSGTLTIPVGQTSATISVLVNGDRLPESNETFFVDLSQATNGFIAIGRGQGTIMDDEQRISIGDVTKSEGKKGQTTLFTFTVTLSAAYDQPVTMSFNTTDGTAKTSDADYVAKSGTLTFNPGETTKTITIVVNGDSKREADETFYLDLFGLSGNALFTKNRGLGTILNDD